MIRFVIATGVVAALAVAGFGMSLAGADTPPTPDWTQYRYDQTHTGFNPAETTLDAGNVALLTLVWSKQAGGANPLVVHGRVVGCTAQACTSRLLDDGRLVWRTPQVQAYRSPLAATPSTRQSRTTG